MARGGDSLSVLAPMEGGSGVGSGKLEISEPRSHSLDIWRYTGKELMEKIGAFDG